MLEESKIQLSYEENDPSFPQRKRDTIEPVETKLEMRMGALNQLLNTTDETIQHLRSKLIDYSLPNSGEDKKISEEQQKITEIASSEVEDRFQRLAGRIIYANHQLNYIIENLDI